jgi:diguanylate cyclase (GGDEF)-like protein
MAPGVNRPAIDRRRVRTCFRVLAGLLVAAVGVLGLNAISGFGSTEFKNAFHTNGFAAISLACAITVLARAVLIPTNRVGWLLFGLGVAGLSAGDLYYNLVLAKMEAPPFPSLGDVLYLSAYPLTIAGLFVLLRNRLQSSAATMWLDAAIGVLAVLSVGLGLMLGTIEEATVGATTLQVVVAAAYPLLDLVMFAMIAAVVALTGARLDRPLLVVMAAMISIGFADVVYFYESVAGSYEEGTIIDVFWPLGGALLATAAWLPTPKTRIVPATGMRALIIPSAFALVVVGYNAITPDGGAPEALGTLALVLLVVRMAVGIRENRELAQRLGLDSLTKLGNRGRLGADLSRAIAFGRPHTLVLADLDGFKLYNDAFGHPAGDAMLSRLAGSLKAAVEGKGSAYRIGGDEFCVLIEGEAREGILDEIVEALTEKGDGFAVGASVGSVQIPAESDGAEAAIQIADQRMYATKDSRRSELQKREALTVLINAQRERGPELGAHVSGVAALAAKVGERLGLHPGEISILKRAAELHDIGKIAIPDAILEKPGVLDDEEWEFMRQHTILGERILASANSLAPYAKIVRSSHERVDGAGYPDGLDGDQIPLASRIIFACDAYNAMTTDRPYAKGRTHEDAVAELRRCAGTQFDKPVVDALCEVLMPQPAAAPAQAKPRAQRSLLPASP